MLPLVILVPNTRSFTFSLFFLLSFFLQRTLFHSSVFFVFFFNSSVLYKSLSILSLPYCNLPFCSARTSVCVCVVREWQFESKATFSSPSFFSLGDRCERLSGLSVMSSWTSGWPCAGGRISIHTRTSERMSSISEMGTALALCSAINALRRGIEGCLRKREKIDR